MAVPAEPRERILTPPTPVEFHIPERESKVHKIMWGALAGAISLLSAIALLAHKNVRDDLADLSRTVNTRGETLAVISTKLDAISEWRKEVDMWRKDVDTRMTRTEAKTDEIIRLLKRR